MLATGLKKDLAADVTDKPYEHWSIYVIAGGREMKTSVLKEDGSTCCDQLKLKAGFDVVRTTDHPGLSRMKKKQDSVFYPTKLNAVAYDASVLTKDGTMVLLQPTTGQNHDIKFEGKHNMLRVIVSSIREGTLPTFIKKVRLIYVVPWDEKFKFEPAVLRIAHTTIKEKYSDMVSIEVAVLTPKTF